MPTGFATRRSLSADLRALGLVPGDAVLVHAALRKVGRVVGGADTILWALRDAVGPNGTLLGYTDWRSDDEALETPALRDHIPPFDPLSSRATRDNGFFPEMLRTTPGALRSGNPGASMAAIGGRAAWFVADHALDYGYGTQSPLGKLVEAHGKVLMLGAPLDTMTLLHHAEHLADIPHRIKRYESPLLIDGRTVWRTFEEYDTSHAPEGFAEDYFATMVEDFLATGNGRRGSIGAAPSVLVDAAAIVPFAVDWMERRARSAS
ncbi:MAG TPA: aminoglycoside 3-N-acetyltransferase [Devosia sp.]|nr:aminoglycoside 3-N-acetyltransferase [Devosia sp.]